MKNLRNKNAPPLADLVQYFIDSAYDNVKLVSDNLAIIIAVSEGLEDGTFDNLVYLQDIDTLAELNAIVADEEIASEAYVNNAVSGLYDHKGSYDADTNTPDLDSAPTGIKKADAYTVSVAGDFFSAPVAAGDVLIANQDDPTLEAHWTIVNRNIDESAFATAEQGAKADTALQPGLVHNISELINNVGFTDDQTPNEIVTAYNSLTPVVTQEDAEAGISTTAQRWTPQRVAQAAKAQTGAIVFVADDHVAIPSQIVFCDSSIKPIQITLPPGANNNSLWIVDAGHYAATNNITIVPNGIDTIDGDTSFILDQDDNFCNVAFNGANTDWLLALSGSPDFIDAPHTHTESDIEDFGSYALSTGFPDINAQSGVTYEFVVLDLEEGVTADNAADSTYSIPDDLGSPGDTINLYNKGAGEVTIDMAGTDTLDTADNNCSSKKAITALKIATTEWAIIGGTAAP